MASIANVENSLTLEEIHLEKPYDHHHKCRKLPNVGGDTFGNTLWPPS
jgi:hypothetical protein